MNTKSIFECVPNISEGRNKNVIRQVEGAIKNGGAKLLHTDIGYDANRTVFTFAGSREEIITSCLNMYHAVFELIDMSMHHGEHPRIGAVDVCPVIPLIPENMPEAVEISHQIAQQITGLDIPIYMYEKSAGISLRTNQANIRKGGYEGITQKMNDPLWQPDYGNFNNSKLFGATVIGARNFLIAYNINIATSDVRIAKKIAGEIRGSGYKDTTGNRVAGLLSSVKAIGWEMESFGCAQVSTNVTNYTIHNITDVYHEVGKSAEKYGTSITGSELIGLIPKNAVERAINNMLNLSEEITDEHILQLQHQLKLIFNKGALKDRILENLL